MKITKDNKKIILANNLKYLMTIHNLSRKELYESLGIPRETLRSWLIAEDYPPIEKIAKLANHFNVSISSLIEDEHQLENLTSYDYKLLYEMQTNLIQQGLHPLYIKMFTINAMFVLKFLKEHNLYGGIDNE